jgi:hypothetical protein
VRGLRDAADQLAVGPVTIAYLGNSVTAQKDSYRPYLHAGLVKRFGHNHRAVNAGFGGIGSIGSVCTADDLVVRHKPALCFIECMTGDMGVGLHADTGPALEGIVRKLAAIDCAACFLNLPRRDEDFSRNNPIVRLYADVAEHYGTPSINLGSDLKSEGPAFFIDAVHTTAFGGRRTADLILERLENIFAASNSPQPSTNLFARDYAGASVTPASVEMLRNQSACLHGRWRIAYPYIDIAPDNAIHFHSTTSELLGLLLVVGPHSGVTIINGVRHQLHDRWSHFDRMHAYIFDKPFLAGTSVAISPIDEIHDAAPKHLKIIGFLVRPAE